MKISGTVYAITIFIVFIIAFVFGVLMEDTSRQTAQYQYINTEQNGVRGMTIYTMIYLYNGEVKYFYYDDPDTEYIFREMTGMNNER